MTRLTSAQQRATRRAVERAWQTRYVQRRKAKKALANLDDSVRHPAGTARPASRLDVADWFNTPTADHVWISPDRPAVVLHPQSTDGLTPEQLAMFSGPPSSQGVQHIAWEDPAPRNLATTQGYADEVYEALQQIAADEKAWAQERAEEQRRSVRRYRIIRWCIWTPVAVVWAIALAQALGAW